jgi:hypothetical protein
MAKATKEMDCRISKTNITRTGSCRVLVTCIQHLFSIDTMQNSVQMTYRYNTKFIYKKLYFCKLNFCYKGYEIRQNVTDEYIS